jgi:hypothetical protein
VAKYGCPFQVDISDTEAFINPQLIVHPKRDIIVSYMPINAVQYVDLLPLCDMLLASPVAGRHRPQPHQFINRGAPFSTHAFFLLLPSNFEQPAKSLIFLYKSLRNLCEFKKTLTKHRETVNCSESPRKLRPNTETLNQLKP